MDYLSLLLDKTLTDLSLARLLEAAILLKVIWTKLKPHLEAIEKRIEGVETAVTTGFKAGELRFQRNERTIESHSEVLLDLTKRVSDIEKQQPTKGVQHEKPGFV